jgi:transposase
MLSPEIRCVVGIDVAKCAHVVCAMEAPSGTVRLTSTPVPATAAGHAQLLGWLGTWAEGEPPRRLSGLESTGSLWEPLYDALTQAGYAVLLLNPHQTASWASSLGLRAKTDGIDAHTLARGLLAGWARASTVPDETIQALRTLTRARRDLVASQSAARQRLHDELVPVFPDLVGQLPEHADLGAPAVVRLLSVSSSAHALAQAPLDDLSRVLEAVSERRWGQTQALALQELAQHSTASTRAVAARAVVVRTLALHLLDLHARVAELEAALAALLRADPPSQRLQGQVPGLGPLWTATIRAELGDVARFSQVDQVVAYAGLEPRTHDSGRYAGQRRLSKRGPGVLRHALSMATLVAVRFRPEWHAPYQRLLDRGRAKKEALTMLSRKLLKVISHLPSAAYWCLLRSRAHLPCPASGAGLTAGYELFLVGVAISALERLAIANVNALHCTSARLDVAGAGGAYREAPHIDPRLDRGQRHNGADDIPRAHACHYAHGLGRFVGESEGVGPTHLPTMPTHRRDLQRRHARTREVFRRARAHAGRVNPVSFG